MKSNILEKADKDLLNDIRFGNMILNKIKTSVLKDISLLEIAHVKSVVLSALYAYLKNTLLDWEVVEFAEIIENILDEKYCDEYPDTLSPRFLENDERSLGINAIIWLDFINSIPLSKQDVEEFIKFLESGDPLKAHQILRAYLYEKYPDIKTWI